MSNYWLTREAASAKNDGEIDVSRRLEKEDNEGQNAGHIAALFSASMYHNSNGTDDDEFDEKFGSSQFDDNPQHET